METLKEKKDRRSYSRLEVYHLAKYRLVNDPEKKLYFAAIADISGGGVRLFTRQNIPISSIIQLYINFPGFSEPIPGLAKVVWAKNIRTIKKAKIYKIGLQFLEIEDILRKAIVKRIEIVRKLVK